MNAGELADRKIKHIESDMDDFDKACSWKDRQDWACVLACTVKRNAETIIKSLRFAADMERLLLLGVVTIHPVDSDFSHFTVVADGKGVHGDDVYEAARNAVEKLEGKNGT